MSTKFRYLFFLCLLSFFSVSAQYTEMINANRPGGSQGAFSVGTDVVQLESGISYGKEKHELLKTETNGLAIDYSIRYGIWKERLELSVMGEYFSSSITYNNFDPTIKQKLSNFKSNTVGAKYLIYDPYRKRELAGPNLYSWKKNHRFQWEDLIPAVSLYVGANIDFEGNPYTPEDENMLSPKLVLATQNNWIGGFVFVTNIIVDRATTEFPSYGYILTLTHATNRYFSIFVENQGIKSDFYADQILRGGAAVLIHPDFQVDLSFSVNFKDTPSKYYARAGVAYRFDMHSKDEYLEDIDPQKIINGDENKKEGENKDGGGADIQLDGER